MELVASAVGRNYRSVAALHGTLEGLSLCSHKAFRGTLVHFTRLRRLEVAGAVGWARISVRVRADGQLRST